jgi:hypothetical protein
LFRERFPTGGRAVVIVVAGMGIGVTIVRVLLVKAYRLREGVLNKIGGSLRALYSLPDNVCENVNVGHIRRGMLC